VASLQDDSVGVATALSPVGAGHFKFYHTTFIVGLGLDMRPFDGQTRAIIPFKETVAAPKSFFRENMAMRINCRTIASLIVRKFRQLSPSVSRRIQVKLPASYETTTAALTWTWSLPASIRASRMI
jgi:hypothetical protein